MKLKSVDSVKNEAINNLLGDEFYLHIIIFIDNKPTSLCYFYKSGKVIERFEDHIKVEEDTYIIYHILTKTPNHNKSVFDITIDNTTITSRFNSFETIDDYTESSTLYEYQTKRADFRYMICIEPGRNTNHYMFLTNFIDEFYNNPINILLDDNNAPFYVYDSRKELLSISRHTCNIQHVNGVDNYINRYMSNLDKAEKDLANIIIDENGEVVSYKSDSGICFERIVNKDSEYPIDYTNLTYFLEKRNVIKKEHIFGSINDIIIDTNEEKDHYISDNGNINTAENVTLIVDIIGKQFKSIIKNGLIINSCEVEGENGKSSPEMSTTGKNNATKINNPDGTYSIINVSNRPGVYDIETCNDKDIKFMHNKFDTESGVSAIYIDKNSSVWSYNQVDVKLSNGINVSYTTDENGKVKQYKDSFQEITFDNEGDIFFYDSDVFKDTGTYYIRDQYGIPHKYCPTLLGFDL